MPANPLKAEFYLPNVPKALIAAIWEGSFQRHFFGSFAFEIIQF